MDTTVILNQLRKPCKSHVSEVRVATFSNFVFVEEEIQILFPAWALKKTASENLLIEARKNIDYFHLHQ